MRRTVAFVIVLAACSAEAAPTTTVAPPTTTSTTTTSSTTSTTSTTLPPTTTTTTAPVDPFDPSGATIPQLQEAMTNGGLTSEDLVRWYLDRIIVLDPELTVFVSISPTAIDEAIALDVERASIGPRGPLHGIPVVIKDNITTFDLPTTAGSVALDGWVAPSDAFQVARLRGAGAIVLGKVNLQEWARSIHGNSSILGRTLNPYDTSHNAGGSSAGTAVAVTTEMAAVGLGTDTCGSIRVPSAFASLWGLRPTIGLSSRGGVVPLSTSEDTVGPMARSVIDLAIVLDATVGEDPADPTTAGADQRIPTTYVAALDPTGLEGARIGVVWSLFGGRGPVYRAMEAALADLEAAGATLVPIEIPNRSALLGTATTTFLQEWGPATEEFFASRPGAPIGSLADVLAAGGYLPETRERLERAVGVTELDTEEYRAALAARSAVADAVVGVMDSYVLDALAYPTISDSPAVLGVDQTGNNCATASVGGLPAISMPAGLTSNGHPVGIELLGRPWSEPTLIRLASGYEAAVNPRVPPPVEVP
jgi:Asp-tRNA(Asn)/Glu-tRNA(Gln) amidotransferase A subunit family amidase